MDNIILHKLKWMDSKKEFSITEMRSNNEYLLKFIQNFGYIYYAPWHISSYLILHNYNTS